MIGPAMRKRRIYWPYGNPASDAWQLEAAAGPLVVRRNHVPATSAGRCQGWDVWLDGAHLGAIGSRTLSELATESREGLETIALAACCGRHSEFVSGEVPKPTRGGARAGAGRKPKGERRRVDLSTSVDPRTLEVLDQLRGSSSRGQYLDLLLQSQVQT
jgi:hypothetical protein